MLSLPVSRSWHQAPRRMASASRIDMACHPAVLGQQRRRRSRQPRETRSHGPGRAARRRCRACPPQGAGGRPALGQGRPRACPRRHRGSGPGRRSGRRRREGVAGAPAPQESDLHTSGPECEVPATQAPRPARPRSSARSGTGRPGARSSPGTAPRAESAAGRSAHRPGPPRRRRRGPWRSPPRRRAGSASLRRARAEGRSWRGNLPAAVVIAPAPVSRPGLRTDTPCRAR
jgi:hypothetical protein